jgi:hypothetical protein
MPGVVSLILEVVGYQHRVIYGSGDRVIWDRVIWDRVIWDRVIWDRVI